MNFRIPAISMAALLCCLSCVEAGSDLGGNFIPSSQKFDTFTAEVPLEDIYLRMADSLSGYSQTRVTIGAIRDDDFGLTTRASAITLVPMYDTLDFGTDPVALSFRFALGLDTVSVADDDDRRILQHVYVYELTDAIEPSEAYDCNDNRGLVRHGSTPISKGTPVINGSDSLTFYFTDEFAQRYVDTMNSRDSLSDFDDYLSKFPGIYLCTDSPTEAGGRINLFDLQLGYSSSYYYITGNYGELTVRSTYEDRGLVDTTFYFYYGANAFYDIDSLMTDSGTGSFPQYALNVTGHDTRAQAVKATDDLMVEGGGGLKPVFRALDLKAAAIDCIAGKLTDAGRDADDAQDAILSRATIVLPFDYSKDNAALLDAFPDMLSPTCRMVGSSTTTFAGLTDASNEDEDQGDINRSLLQYSPDITYHLQKLIQMPDSTLAKGNYDVWMLIMAEETTTTTSSSDDDLSEYYQYLAYQSYYNSMYGGYSGYSSYGSDYYSNYYSYMMAAMYASSSSSSTTTSTALDRDRFYKARLCGPASSTRRPSLKLTFSVPKK